MVENGADILTSDQIHCNLVQHKITCPFFEGVFALDELPKHALLNLPALIVCNTAYSKSPGEHWVCFFVEDMCVEYFDSYGCPPSNVSLLNFISVQGGDGRRFNTRCLQSVDSTTCGKYVTTYLLHRCSGGSMESYVSAFGEDADKEVRALYRRQFPLHSGGAGGQLCKSKCI